MKNPKSTSSIFRRRVVRRVMRLERLRERVALDADGFDGAGLGVSDPIPWFDPGALTYSFVPDNTLVAGQTSQLFQQLGELGDSSDWQAEFDAAFNAWLTPLGVRTSEVPDSGDPIGVDGKTQGDHRFGDVRIAAIPLSRGVHATSVPHSVMVQGSWAGDILINANVHWNNLQEVYAVALHEYGHVLGLGHSRDSASPLFVHGVHNVTEPTTADIAALQNIYAGIRFEDKNESVESEESTVHNVELSGSDVLNSAIILQPTIGSSIRYVGASEIVDPAAPIVFELQPTTVDAKGLENLTIALRWTESNRLTADVKVIDAKGETVESHVLHHGQGNVVVQAMSVESDEVHYVVISPSSDSRIISQLGSFEVVADYGPELRLSREIGDIQVDAEHPVMDLPISVSSSRLVHVHLETAGESDSSSLIRAVLLNEQNQILTNVSLRPGTSRSAPLTFLPAGQYTLRIVGTTELATLPDTQLTVFIDEVSIDVGPGVSDPTDSPYLPCDEPDVDPDYCYVYTPIVSGSPTSADPNEPEIHDLYWWWWKYGYTCQDYSLEDFTALKSHDPLWLEVYKEVCVASNEPTVSATPITPVSPTTPVAASPVTPTVPVQPSIPVTPTTYPLLPQSTQPTSTTTTSVQPTTTVVPTTPVQPTNPDPFTPTTPVQSSEPFPDTPTTPTQPAVLRNPMQNTVNRFDVSNDAQVSALDALLVVNYMSRNRTNELTTESIFSGQYLDVNGDFHVSALDALLIINSLNVQSSVEAELVDVVLQPPTDFITTTDRASMSDDRELSQLF